MFAPQGNGGGFNWGDAMSILGGYQRQPSRPSLFGFAPGRMGEPRNSSWGGGGLFGRYFAPQREDRGALIDAQPFAFGTTSDDPAPVSQHVTRATAQHNKRATPQRDRPFPSLFGWRR